MALNIGLIGYDGIVPRVNIGIRDMDAAGLAKRTFHAGNRTGTYQFETISES